jgi:membrane protease YdiL (CAAX protease family)
MPPPSFLDHAVVVLITVGLPLHVLLFWFPRVKRLVLLHPRWARHRAYLEGNVTLWQRVTLLREAHADEVRGALLRHLEPVRPILPHTPGEVAHFGLVSLSAGVCEEILFRGFVLAYLQALVPGFAALFVSALLFGMAHAYQGNRGVLQTGVVGLVLGAFFLMGGSLWVPMLLHAAVDMNSGLTAYAILREPREG